MNKLWNIVNNSLVGGVTVLFLAFNGMFYSIFDRDDKVSVYFLLVLAMIFYFMILVIHAIFKNNNSKSSMLTYKVIEVIENNSGVHLILKNNENLSLNSVCSVYFTEKNGYELFEGIGYVYNIAKDGKIDIKMLVTDDCDFVVKSLKNKKNIVIKTNLNIENIQTLGGCVASEK